MTWRAMSEYPEHEDKVLICNRWGDVTFGFCEFNRDGSRSWVSLSYDISSSNQVRYRWCDVPTLPGKEEWSR